MPRYSGFTYNSAAATAAHPIVTSLTGGFAALGGTGSESVLLEIKPKSAE